MEFEKDIDLNKNLNKKIDLYLMKNLEKKSDNSFHILMWGRVNAVKYPISYFSSNCQRLFVLLVSIVASIFSRRDRKLSCYKSSLSLKTIKALVRRFIHKIGVDY